MNQLNSKNLSIAGFQLKAVPTGIFGLDGGAMFGTVPRVLWEKNHPADFQHRIQLEARALLLDSPKTKILIDCGNGGDFLAKYGPKLGPKFAEIYNLKSNRPSVVDSLESLGIAPEAITHVILTHLHFDHCGGGTTQDSKGELVPTFPKARYMVQRRNLETAKNPNRRERASYFPANFEPLLNANVLDLIDGNQTILPGISVEVSDGHTQGHQSVWIEDPSNCVLYAGDLVPTSSHVRLPWVMGYDLDPLKLMGEKERILRKLADKNGHLYFEHDPICDLAQVLPKGEDFEVTSRFQLANLA